MRDFYIFLGWSAGFFGLLILLAVVGPYPLNNWEAHKVGAWLTTVELPEKSELLERETSVANFAGTGNACFFAAGEIRSTSLSKKELLAFYAQRVRESSDLRVTRTFEIFFPDDEDTYQYLDDTFTDLIQKYAHASSTDTFYLALAVDGPHEPGLDFRCH